MAEPGSSSRPNKRLTRDGAAYLTDYVRYRNAYPSRQEKLDMLATLRAMPGNEMFTLEKLTSFINRHRPIPQPVLPDEESILFPKLNPTQLQQLRALYRKRPDPPENILIFWAERLNVDRDEVLAWIQFQQEKAKGHDVGTTASPDIPSRYLVGDSDSASASPTTSEFPRPHLPTPSKSLSPSISPQTRMSLPPIVVKVEDPRQCLSPDTPSLSYSHESRSALDGLPPLTRHRPQVQAVIPPPRVAISVPNALLRSRPRRESNTMLASAIKNSLRPNTSPNQQAPRTADEFAEKFNEVENMIDSFMKKFDGGQLVQLGWDKSLCQLAP